MENFESPNYNIEFFPTMGSCEFYKRKSFFGLLEYWGLIDITYDFKGPKQEWFDKIEQDLME